MKGNKGKIIIAVTGLILLVLSLVNPVLLQQWPRGIVAALENSIWEEDKSLLLLAAAQVVAYHALLMFPYVGGSMVLANLFKTGGYGRVLRWGLPLAVVPVLHYMVFQKLDYPPPVMVVTLVMILVVALALRIGLGRTGLASQILIPGLVVLAVNSLSIVPFLAPYGLADGDLTWETLLAGRFLKGETLLNSTGLVFFVVVLVMALVASELTALYQRRLEDLEELKKVELQSQRSQFHVQELRVLQEMHTLVHDLKTPLMTVQGLNSLIQMAVRDEQLQDYTRRIEGAVDNLNKMISEILYDDVRKEVSVEELITYVRAHVLVKMAGQKISFHLAEHLPLLQVNLIRLARALINLIENAFTATSGVVNGEIKVTVEAGDDNRVTFTVADNGVGIPEHLLDSIWASSYSTKATPSGLGLGFVKRVAENHQGTISINSQPGRGTIVRVVIPGVCKDEQNPDN